MASNANVNSTTPNNSNPDPIMLVVKEIVTMMESSSSGATTSESTTFQRSFCISNGLAQGNPMLYLSQGYAKMAASEATTPSHRAPRARCVATK